MNIVSYSNITHVASLKCSTNESNIGFCLIDDMQVAWRRIIKGIPSRFTCLFQSAEAC